MDLGLLPCRAIFDVAGGWLGFVNLNRDKPELKPGNIR